MPVCQETDIKMAIHMDDPPWDIFGLPRLLVDEPSIDRFLKMVDNPYNCLTLCSGSLGASLENNVADIVRKHHERIAFAHIRNVKHFENGFFSTAQNAKLLWNEDGTPTARTGKILAGTPMGRFGETEELIGATLFLMSEEASGFVDGVVIPVDGGYAAYSGV